MARDGRPLPSSSSATRFPSEDRNAALSLAANLAIADALQAHQTGLFRVMAGPDERAVKRLRFTARALGIDWPAGPAAPRASSAASIRRDPKQAAFMAAIRRAGTGAGYVPYRDGVVPWHAALAATYAHATAPLRRLADRYVVQAALASRQRHAGAGRRDRRLRTPAQGDGRRRRAQRARSSAPSSISPRR